MTQSHIYHFPQGGGVTLGAMVPILLLSYIYGPLVGMLSGFLFGILSLFFNPYIMHPIQVLFDYPLPFAVLGLAGFFASKVNVKKQTTRTFYIWMATGIATLAFMAKASLFEI